MPIVRSAGPRADATPEGGAEKKISEKPISPKSNIVVCLPVENDREAVRALARKLHNMTIFSDAKFDKLFDRAMARSNHMSGLVAELVSTVAEHSDAQASGINRASRRTVPTPKVEEVKESPSVARQAPVRSASPRTEGLPDGSSDKRIIGMAMVTAGEFYIGQDEILSTVQLIGVDEDLCGSLLSGKTFLRLIQAIKKWGELRGAKRTLVHVTTGKNLAVTDRLMRASGAKCIGDGYVVQN